MTVENIEKVDKMINRTFGSCVVKEKIAVGGFGTVYKAIDTKLDVPRALKIFHPHLSEEKGFRQRFEIEMRLLAQLDHINIVRIISAIDEPDITGFIMEYVEGKTLADILEDDGSFAIQTALDVFIQVGKSIAYAHNLKHQIIHRDLSPDNIMIRPDDVVKIMDFGIAKTIGSERVTQTGIVLGKPTYMAPEQFEGTVSAYTDQYALGVILYEMVTGRVPFDAESPIALYKLHLNEDPIPPAELNDKVPTFLNNVILKTLAKDEKDRFKNVDELIDVLLNQGSPTTRLENKITPLIIDAHLAVDRENFGEALEIYDKILAMEPTNKEALTKKQETLQLVKTHREQDLIEEWFHQAQAFHEAAMHDEAFNYVKDFLKLACHYQNSKTVTRYIASLQKRMPETFSRAQATVKEELENSQRITRIGKKLFQQNKFAEALEKFEEALLINPYSELIQKLQSLCHKKIKMAKIAEMYRDAIMALKNEKYAEAVHWFEEVLKLHSGHKDARKYLEMAQAELSRLQKNRSEVDDKYKQAVEEYNNWNFTRAIKIFEEVLHIDNKHKDAEKLLKETKDRIDEGNKMEEIAFFYNQGMTFFKGQQWDKAIKCYERVLKYMETHIGAEKYKQLAEKKLKDQVQINQALQDGLENFRNSKYTQAIKSFDFILTLDKNHKGARQYKTLCDELRGLGAES